MKKNYTTLDQ